MVEDQFFQQLQRQAIREHNQLEVALRQSEERYRALSELTSDYTYAYRLEPNGTFVPELLNEAFTRVCGYTLEELSIEGWKSLIPFKERPLVLRHVERLMLGEADICEHRIITKSGEIRWVRNYARPVEGGMLRIYGAAQDITERKQAETEREQLLKREQEARIEAEAANRLKDEFLAILSHELRSPLNAILGWAQLLCQQKFNEVTTAKALQIIQRNALLQAKLIEELLDISYIIRGKLVLQKNLVNLMPVIESAISTVQLAADAKAIQLVSELDSDAGLVLGDMDRLQQVFWNLLANAIKFTPDGGQVEIRLERVNAQIEVTVSDTGQGISPDFLPFIFGRFRQADSTTTRLHGGLGLGLAIVRQLVEQHGGTVLVMSLGSGQGATFTVQLPLASTEQQTSASGQKNLLKNDSKLSDVRVLVVDDEADARELIAIILQHNGAQVTTTASVREALQALEIYQPDVIVSDIGMPDEDGYTLIRQVRALEAQRGKFFPAVALTAFARAEDCQQALMAGFQSHVTKPIQPAELVAVVASLAQQIGNQALKQDSSVNGNRN